MKRGIGAAAAEDAPLDLHAWHKNPLQRRAHRPGSVAHDVMLELKGIDVVNAGVEADLVIDKEEHGVVAAQGLVSAGFVRH